MYMPLLRRYSARFSKREYQVSLFFSVLAFVTSLFVNFFAIQFATYKASNSVTDIILSNTRAYEVDGLFVYGTLVFALFTAVILIMQPKRIPFALYALALFYLIRSLFTILTHIAPFEATYVSDFGPWLNKAFFGGDLFFSGHTGMPFLGVLVFWREPWVRNIFIAASAYFATVVLLGHLHYSIDVLSAFFITYGIYQIALYLFPKEALWFSESEPIS